MKLQKKFYFLNFFMCKIAVFHKEGQLFSLFEWWMEKNFYLWLLYTDIPNMLVEFCLNFSVMIIFIFLRKLSLNVQRKLRYLKKIIFTESDSCRNHFLQSWRQNKPSKHPVSIENPLNIITATSENSNNV